MNDQETKTRVLGGAALEMAIASTPFPKITVGSIEARISKVDYLVLPDSTVTLCNITLENGYSVRGESACVDPRNYNLDIGKGLAYKDAFGKLWALEGYLMAERGFLAEAAARGPGTVIGGQAVNRHRQSTPYLATEGGQA